jgi:hypothetical protein
MRPQADYTTKDFLNDLLTDLTEASINTPQGSNIDIVTFANSILFNDSTTKLWPTQEAILKAIYNEPLDQVHIDILDRWREQGKTNWINGRKYTNLILEAGRGCPVETSNIITSVGTITYKELHERKDEDIYIYTVDSITYKVFTTNKFRTWDQGLQKAYSITLKSGKTEEVTSDHPYLVKTAFGPCWIQIKDLNKKDKVAVLNNLTFASSNTEYVIEWEEVVKVKAIGYKNIIGFEVEDTHIIGNSIVSHNSSKSSMSSIICLYEFYKLISLPDPGLHYGLMSFSPIALFAIAQTEAQVLETSFKAIKSFLDSSNFFKSLIKKKKIVVLSDEIRCPDKFISLYAKHTNSKALVGYNLKLLFIDEMARFETTGDGLNTGLNIYQNVGRALNRFKGEGKKIVVSSAWSFTDPMVTLKHQAAGDPYSLILELTCFDVNPTITRSNPDIISDYSSEPKRARLEYENIRSSNDNSFLEADLLDKLCSLQSSIDVMEYNLDIEDRHYRGIKINRISNVNTACFIHVDTSLKKDATAMSIATINNRGQIEVIGIACWTPGIDEKGKFREVSYINIEEILIYISQYMNIMSISFDGFNSSSLNQNLYSRGLNTKIVSFSREKQLAYYNLLRQLIQRGDVLFPIDSPWTALIKTDLPSLVIKDNGQIVHPYGTKDLPDALAVSVFEAYTYGSNCNLINKIELKAPKLININTPRKITVGSSINRLQQHKERNTYRGY